MRYIHFIVSPLNPTTLRLNAADKQLSSLLRQKIGVTKESEILRMGLRALAREHNVPIPTEQDFASPASAKKTSRSS